MITGKIIKDSIYEGFRLTTMEICFQRYILSEFNTHRMFSRNSASSRAIPIEKQLKKIREDLAFPEQFGSNQSGMQAGPPLWGEDLKRAQVTWSQAAADAVGWAEELLGQGVHKQVTNRLLEPFMWHTVVVSSIDYLNFYALRDSPLAQPEIEKLAQEMKVAHEASIPTELKPGEWHLPYILDDELDNDIEMLKKVSAARTGRVSYLTQDGVRSFDKDLELYERLTSAEPPHASPLEHVATPCPDNFYHILDADLSSAYIGNFPAWLQLRHADKQQALRGPILGLGGYLATI